jgi:hypothetical protein
MRRALTTREQRERAVYLGGAWDCGAAHHNEPGIRSTIVPCVASMRFLRG